MNTFFSDLLGGSLCVLVYFVILAASALTLRVTVKINDEVFRKLLHCILLGSFPVCLWCFDSPWASVVFCILFAALVFPILWFFERFRSYSKTVTERKKGELKTSLLVVFGMFAFVIAVCVGLCGDRPLALASVLAWGIGDAAAALIGKRFGRHRIPNSKKSFEGCFAMFFCSFASVLVILIVRGGMVWYAYPIIAFAVGIVSTVVELYTTGGFDTVTCPTAAMCLLLPLTALFGGI